MKTILLIDDDANIRRTYSLILKHHGYRVLEAASGDVGLEMAQRELPDLIVTDVVMPGIDGKSVLEQIRQNPDLRHKQVIMLTGHPDAVTPRRGMELGADDFLLKPVRLEELIRGVEARLGRAETLSQAENRMLDQLRSNLHATLPLEFSVPVTGIIGLTEKLRSRTDDWSRDEIDAVLADIANTATRLQRTQRNYLMILDHPAEAPPAFPFAELLPPPEIKVAVWAGVEAATGRTGRKNDVLVQLASTPLLVCAGDLHVIVEELVDNACNYSPGGTPVKVLLSEDGCLSVCDAGGGISPDELARMGLFQRFERKGLSKRVLGLGLVLVQKLAAKWDATFSVSSTSEGTRVMVEFRTQIGEKA